MSVPTPEPVVTTHCYQCGREVDVVTVEKMVWIGRHRLRLRSGSTACQHSADGVVLETDVIADPDLSGVDKSVYLQLVLVSDENRYSTLKDFADDAGCSPSTARRSFSRLKNAGVLA